MSETSTSTISATGRVVVEIDASGKLWMEYYTNGARTRQLLTRGDEWWQIADELSTQRKAATASAERAQQAAAAASRRRHHQVWTNTAEKFGAGFAAKNIKGETPIGYGKYLLPEAAAKPPATPKPSTHIDDMLDLL